LKQHWKSQAAWNREPIKSGTGFEIHPYPRRLV
jgi:hypothetical protein